MSLSNAVQGARHTAQQINWADGDGDPLNLTGATVTGRLLDLATGTARAITGTTLLVDGGQHLQAQASDVMFLARESAATPKAP